MRHAYLIIAHDEFDVLRLLLKCLDDECNDIYVHIDKKVKLIPELHTIKSCLTIIDKRKNVHWGNVSQIETELLLFDVAYKKGPYDFYHLISGTHLPLKNIDEINAFYTQYSGECIFSNLMKRDGDYQEILKMHRINVCTSGYASSNMFVSGASRFLWKSCIAVQRWLNFTVNNGIQFYWANNWCSLSQNAVEYLLSIKKKIRRRYRWSFCGDEWFVPTELMDSVLKDEVIDSKHLLYGSIGRSNAPVLTMDNACGIKDSDCCFGRKFTSDSKELIAFLNIN